MTIVRRLSAAAFGMHFADQIALVCVPLVTALAFGASPIVIGFLVACQSMAHLLGSIPFGILVDQKPLRSLAIAAAMLSLVGFLGAATAVYFGQIIWFGLAITMAGFGVVLFGLTVLSILPKAVDSTALAPANAAVEIPRAFCSFAVPLLIGLIVADVSAVVIFLLAALGAVGAAVMAMTLPGFAVSPKQKAPILPQIVEGGRYVLRHALLLPIALCAVFWNFAFAALLVIMVPIIQQVYQLDPGTFGIALSAFGLAAVLGSWASGRFSGRVAPAVILLFGPGSSLVAVIGMSMIGAQTPQALLLACFFLLGFGPSMWLVAQNSVRQLVTPPALLGRVNAMIQTAIYGIRPLGAVAGGAVAGAAGPQAGMLLVVIAFALSFAVAACSALRRVDSYDSLHLGEI